MANLKDRIAGCVIGGAIGDAMGVPFEGRTGPLQFATPNTWTISDDTQLTLATCEAIIGEHGQVSPEPIANELCKWFREGRISGIGASTLKALRELEAGGHWALVGRKGEMAAGNGAAMRVAPLGFFLNPRNQSDRVSLRDVCRITHHNEEAYVGALAMVATIQFVAFKDRNPGQGLLNAVHRVLPDSRVRDRISEVREFVQKSKSIQECGSRFGSSGYVVDSVPLSLAAMTFMPRLGFRTVLESVIECGGDTDTVASMTGQLMGAACGLNELPDDLVRRIDSLGAIRTTAARLHRLTTEPYTSSELERIPSDGWPRRGEYCGKCHTWIPRFSAISDEEEVRLRGLSRIEAIKELRAKTSCSLRWAKIWAIHPNGPEPRDAGPPCPECDEPLRTEKAQQCLNCGADWHNAQ